MPVLLESYSCHFESDDNDDGSSNRDAQRYSDMADSTR